KPTTPTESSPSPPPPAPLLCLTPLPIPHSPRPPSPVLHINPQSLSAGFYSQRRKQRDRGLLRPVPLRRSSAPIAVRPAYYLYIYFNPTSYPTYYCVSRLSAPSHTPNSKSQLFSPLPTPGSVLCPSKTS
ncbi:hypothetical protein BDDG_12182, partial [Blastomyces dermatitidis ATCC 18188]